MSENHTFLKFNGKINRRLPQDEIGDNEVSLRWNWLSRNNRLVKPPGHKTTTTGLTDISRWMARYQTFEVGALSPKTFVYTEDGRIWVLNDQTGAPTVVKELLKVNSDPRHWLFKTGSQTNLFLVDGDTLFIHDGNNANTFDVVTLTDSGGSSVHPIDLIEHKDRLCVISRNSLFISKNLEPTNFTDANDSIEIIVGSGKGQNLALGKIEDHLFIFNTEGIFVLDGDVISALAITFEVRLVDERKLGLQHSVVKVEQALIFVADDYELWSFDGSSSKMLSYELKLKDFVNTYALPKTKANAVYHDNYYKLSFVEKGLVEPNTEIWWDAFEDKIDIVKGRNVSCYMKTDPTIEAEILQMGQSNANTIVQEGTANDFNGTAIATRLRTKDYTPKKGHNVRFTAFYPEFEPTGNRDLTIIYLLDGRLSNPQTAFTSHLQGETTTLGTVNINNQAQFTGRVRPSINYAHGQSIAFEVIEATLGLKSSLVGIGIDFIVKERKKSDSLIGAV